jgi:hypothetical protein
VPNPFYVFTSPELINQPAKKSIKERAKEDANFNYDKEVVSKRHIARATQHKAVTNSQTGETEIKVTYGTPASRAHQTKAARANGLMEINKESKEYKAKRILQRRNLIALAANTIENEDLKVKAIPKENLVNQYLEINKAQLKLLGDVTKMPAYEEFSNDNLKYYLENSKDHKITIKKPDSSEISVRLTNDNSFLVETLEGSRPVGLAGKAAKVALKDVKAAILHRTMRGVITYNANKNDSSYNNLYKLLKNKPSEKQSTSEKKFLIDTENTFRSLKDNQVFKAISYISEIATNFKPKLSENPPETSRKVLKGHVPIEYMMIKNAGFIKNNQPTLSRFSGNQARLKNYMNLLPVKSRSQIYTDGTKPLLFTSFHTNAHDINDRKENELSNRLVISGFQGDKHKFQGNSQADEHLDALFLNRIDRKTGLSDAQRLSVDELIESQARMKQTSDDQIRPEVLIKLKDKLAKVNLDSIKDLTSRSIVNTINSKLKKDLYNVKTSNDLKSFNKNLKNMLAAPQFLKVPNFKNKLNEIVDLIDNPENLVSDNNDGSLSSSGVSSPEVDAPGDIIPDAVAENHNESDQNKLHKDSSQSNSKPVEPSRDVTPLNTNDTQATLPVSENNDTQASDLILEPKAYMVSDNLALIETITDIAKNINGILENISDANGQIDIKKVLDSSKQLNPTGKRALADLKREYSSKITFAAESKELNFVQGIQKSLTRKPSNFYSADNDDTEDIKMQRQKLLELTPELNKIMKFSDSLLNVGNLTHKESKIQSKVLRNFISPINSLKENELNALNRILGLSNIISKTPSLKVRDGLPPFKQTIEKLIPHKTAKKLLDILEIKDYSDLSRIESFAKNSDLSKAFHGSNLGSLHLNKFFDLKEIINEDEKSGATHFNKVLNADFNKNSFFGNLTNRSPITNALHGANPNSLKDLDILTPQVKTYLIKQPRLENNAGIKPFLDALEAFNNLAPSEDLKVKPCTDGEDKAKLNEYVDIIAGAINERLEQNIEPKLNFSILGEDSSGRTLALEFIRTFNETMISSNPNVKKGDLDSGVLFEKLYTKHNKVSNQSTFYRSRAGFSTAKKSVEFRPFAEKIHAALDKKLGLKQKK